MSSRRKLAPAQPAPSIGLLRRHLIDKHVLPRRPLRGLDGDVEHALLYLGKEFIWGQMYPQSKQVEDRRQKIRRKWGPIQVYSLNARLFAKVGQHIDNLIRDPKGLPNGKGNRTKLTLANAEKWAAEIAGPAYAIDDETAIKVVDGTVEVISEGHWTPLNR